MVSTSTGGRRAAKGDRGAAIRPHVFPPFMIMPASPGDHAAIFRLLRTAMHRPSLNEFQAQLEEPLYEPTDRLIARRNREIVGHALLTKREMHFGDLSIPISGLHDLVTLPEYRRQGLGGELLRQAEQQMKAESALIGVLSTSQPGFFARRGWSAWPQPCFTVAGARDILSLIRANEPEPRILPGSPPPSRQCNIRLQRAVELPALIRLFNEHSAGLIGPTVRNEQMWRWLIGRQGFDRVYVAINGPDRMELDDQFEDIVGYAIVRGGVLMEMVTGDHPTAGRRLLERVCGDAIEHDRELIRIEAPPHDALHEFAREAGGRSAASVDAPVQMAKIFDLERFIELLEPRFVGRVRDSGLGPKCELGIIVDGKKFKLSVNRRKVKFGEDNIGRSYISCSRAALEQLLLGYWTLEDALAQGVIASSTRVATERAKVLFPRLSVWRPSFDDAEGE